MISHACPIVVLDDEKEELWQVSHGLSFCGLPVMTHLVTDGELERIPTQPYDGIRLLVTDLHLLGPSQSKPELIVSALIKYIKQLVSPSSYLLIFWSNYEEEAADAWNFLSARIPPNLKPFGYATLSKEDAKEASSDENAISAPAILRIKERVESIIQQYPQLEAIMEWESNVSRSAAETTNQLLRTISRGGIEFGSKDAVRAVMARMAQEALGYPHAPSNPTKGLTEALLPIVQEWLEQNFRNDVLNDFLNISDTSQIKLPNADLAPLLNDFFIHSEGRGNQALDRGAVTRLTKPYLEDFFCKEIGCISESHSWKEVICSEFRQNWLKLSPEDRLKAEELILADGIYAIELSADCDHAQNKPRSQRFLLSYFMLSSETKLFLSGMKGANESIYVTPEITINGNKGRFLISCRSFWSRRHGDAIEGTVITRLRKDVISELAHHYSTHMRRPGKIAFF